MRFIIIAIVFTAFGCTTPSETKHPSLIYLPSIEYLKEGVVAKYYSHRLEVGGQNRTDIIYKKMHLINDTLINENFNAEFKKSYTYSLKLAGNKWKTISEKSITYHNSLTEPLDEHEFVFKKNIHTDWVNDDAAVMKTLEEDGFGNMQLVKQISNVDSLAGNKKVKTINYTRTIIPIRDSVTQDSIIYDVSSVYHEGLGMTLNLMQSDKYKFEMKLDEVMSLDEFERRSNHGTQRVGYIDTLQTIDDYSQFQPCYHQDKINDYYNDKEGGFLGGKGRLREVLSEKLDPKKIEGESGYLTYRFVINCEGEAGWFVTEEAGLDYQKKEFSEECRMHLFDILKQEKKWTNLVIGEEARDAYTYLTFKMKNGEIIETLP